MKPVSLMLLSVQVRFTCVALAAEAARPLGAAGGETTLVPLNLIQFQLPKPPELVLVSNARRITCNPAVSEMPVFVIVCQLAEEASATEPLTSVPSISRWK